MVQIIHQLVGRARFKVSGLRNNRLLARFLARELYSQKGVVRVSVNPITGNILVIFTKMTCANDLASLLIGALKAYCLKNRPEHEGLGEREEFEDFRENGHLRPWHASAPDEIVRYFNTSPTTGLSQDEAEKRLDMHGMNFLPGITSRSLPKILKSQATAFPVLMTGAAACLSILTGGLVEGMAALAIAAVNAAVGTVLEHQAEKSLDTIKGSVRLSARVCRDGQLKEIAFDSIVPGDLLDLEAGSRVPADARLIVTDHLSVDESALTGESIPVNKSARDLARDDVLISGRLNMVYRGTLVVEGCGRAVVAATGNDTVLGRLQVYSGAVFPPEALVAADIRRISKQLMMIGFLASTGLFLFSLFRGYRLLRLIRNGLALMAVAIPSGISTLTVGAFALGQNNLRRRRILVRRLRALGNLASTQVVCFDKTGTLTLNRMTVSALYAGSSRLNIGDISANSGKGINVLATDPDLSWLISLSTLCNEAFIHHDGDPSLEGSSTERALIYLAESLGIDTTAFRGDHPILEIFHRTDEHHYMRTVHRWDERQELTVIKGSPLEVLEMCGYVRKKGQVHPMGDVERSDIEAENASMAGAGLRVLGVGYRWRSEGSREKRFIEDGKVIWAGLAGLADPIRRGARSLIQNLHQAGIKTAVITGDQSLTAHHMGEQLGLSGDVPLTILDATDLRGLDAAGMQSVATRAHVFARLTPTQKLQIIQAYQNAGMGVVMVGDGFNDVLALKVADVGIAMGREGADLARQSADLVLEDDNLQSVMAAIADGRAFYENIRQSLRFLMTATDIDLLAEFATRSGLSTQGLSPLQSIWTNLACLAIAADPARSELMNRPPINPDETLIGEKDVEKTFRDAARITAVSGLTAVYGLARDAGPGTSRLFWQSVSINQLLHTLPSGQINDRPSGWAASNKLLQATVIAAAGTHLLSTLLSGGGIIIKALDLAALGASAWLFRRFKG
jgi:Ca2+-transporting ATPase